MPAAGRQRLANFVAQLAIDICRLVQLSQNPKVPLFMRDVPLTC